MYTFKDLVNNMFRLLSKRFIKRKVLLQKRLRKTIVINEICACVMLLLSWSYHGDIVYVMHGSVYSVFNIVQIQPVIV